MKVIDFPQGTPEWLASRAGRVTASKVSDALAKTQKGESAVRVKYLEQIAAEIITGKPQGSSFTNAAMQTGTEREPVARSMYESIYGMMVEEVGLVLHPTIERGAASPDGLVGTSGCIEIKCPMATTHMNYWADGVAPANYMNQMQWVMACTGRDWCDFISYHPDFDEETQLFVVRVPRDEKRIAEMEEGVLKFLDEAGQIVKKFNSRRV